MSFVHILINLFLFLLFRLCLRVLLRLSIGFHFRQRTSKKIIKFLFILLLLIRLTVFLNANLVKSGKVCHLVLITLFVDLQIFYTYSVDKIAAAPRNDLNQSILVCCIESISPQSVQHLVILRFQMR